MPKIMLIEDDPTMILLLKTLLEMEGYEVSQWTGTPQIQPEIRQNRPEYILLDINLKGENGFDVLAGLRADPETRAIRVIMSSGMDYRKECKEAGADGFIAKPYMPDDLIRLLQEQPTAGGQ